MKAIIKEAFKFDRQRELDGATQARGTCYVPEYAPCNRKHWNNEIISRWTGRCYYTNISIAIGSTAGLNFKLPVARVDEFGSHIVFHHENLVWCHQGIALLKGNMTDKKFMHWLRNDLIDALEVNK